jgi:hypothetical protein
MSDYYGYYGQNSADRAAYEAKQKTIAEEKDRRLLQDAKISSYGYNPKKVIYITKNGADWKTGYTIADKIVLYTENDLSFSVAQSYEDPIAEIMTAARGTIAGKIINGFAGVAEFSSIFTNTRLMTEYTGAKAWKNSSQIAFDLQFNFYMGMADAYDGKTEVYNPIAALANVFLPKVVSTLAIHGPGPSYVDILTKQGQASIDALKDTVNTFWETITTKYNAVGGQTDALAKELTSKRTGASDYISTNSAGNINIRIGNIYSFYNVLPIDFTFSFSKETDSNGFPIYGSCSIHCETFKMATTESIPQKPVNIP